MEDWNRLWSEARLNYTLGQKNVSSPAFWDVRWKQFERSVENGNDRLKWILSNIEVGRDDTVIDIGSGPGVLSIPLARIAKHVTPVDISTVALDQIENRVKKEGINNIRCVAKKWEDIELGKDIRQCDIVIASYSLTMLDLKDALFKMNEAAIRAVYIFETAGQKYWHHQQLWPRLYGEKFISSPDYIYILNVLYQMGIYADVLTTDYEVSRYFPTLEEAVRYWQESLAITTNQASDIIREYLLETLVHGQDGLYSKGNQKMVMISWKKGVN